MENNSSDPPQGGSAPVANSSSSRNEVDTATRRNRLMRNIQHTIDMDDGSEASTSNSDDRNSFHPMIPINDVRNVDQPAEEDEASRLFEDYIRERESVRTEIYNSELPTEHAYMGKLERVEGVDYLEPGKTYRMPTYNHHSIVFPGEIVPLMLNSTYLYTVDDASDGLKFGLVFQDQSETMYGVTCQVYERGNVGDAALLKTVAQQRFIVVGRHQERSVDIQILPEIVLPDPLLSASSNAMVRFAHSPRKETVANFKRLLTQATAWPQFVYDQYGTNKVLTKVERYLSSLKITGVPTDPIKLSFWLARNIPLTEQSRKYIFTTNLVWSRMLTIDKALDQMSYFICKRCFNEVANYSDIFAMSKQGVQTSYCNPEGFVHDTLTVYKTKENSTLTVGQPSAEFSWFPGYSWQIIVCATCRHHLGWKFVASKNNFFPKSFCGLSGTNITVKSHGDAQRQQEGNRGSVIPTLHMEDDMLERMWDDISSTDEEHDNRYQYDEEVD